MTRLMKGLMLGLLLAGMLGRAAAFSLLGPYETWQVTPLGYNLPGDIGGPKTPPEGYRWNTPTITYAFDPTFIHYFGINGMLEVDKAMKIFNDLPAFSSITNDGSSLYIDGEPVPTDVNGPPNFGEGIAGVLDLKSWAMGLVIEELGLAEPERYTWTIRGRATFPGTTNYGVIMMNYDPITLQPSSKVNGFRYGFQIFDPIPNINYADAVETLLENVNPYSFSSVATGFIGAGNYYMGLSHDDVGGLRYLYNANRLVTEQLLGDVTGGIAGAGVGSPWRGFLGITNTALLTNIFVVPNASGTNLIRTGLRPGINKLKFKRANFDSLIGNFFLPVTNQYTDTVISNSRPVLQVVRRVVTQPDILFSCEDLLLAGAFPVLVRRTVTDGWQNNAALNTGGFNVGGGPGVITPQVRISFSNRLPYVIAIDPGDVGDDETPNSGCWGSFDENSEEPVLYPNYLGLTLRVLQQNALRGGP